MFFFFHFLTGCALGLLVGMKTQGRAASLAIVLGSILPDLIDKPVGELLFPSSIGYGRIFFHSLTFVILFAIAATFTFRTRWALPLGAISAGMLVHQLLDGMWWEPRNWFWPFLGPFMDRGTHEDLIRSLFAEITSPSEWLFLLATLAILTILFSDRARAVLPVTLAEFFRGSLRILPVILVVIALYAVVQSLYAVPFNLTGLQEGYDNIMFAAGMGAVALALWIRNQGDTAGSEISRRNH
jgi:membrane-bound metal-dependent hydrolase YbcI (DUF457 family)